MFNVGFRQGLETPQRVRTEVSVQAVYDPCFDGLGISVVVAVVGRGPCFRGYGYSDQGIVARDGRRGGLGTVARARLRGSFI